jgi:hypothetical protein
MGEFSEYLLEEIVANIRKEMYESYYSGYEDAYIIKRLNQVAEYIVKESKK